MTEDDTATSAPVHSRPASGPTASQQGAQDTAVSGYRAVFAVREFRAVFAAHLLSVLGGVFAEVALAVLVFHQTGSALLTALIFALGFLPYALSGVLLSGLADRHPSRRLLVICDLLSAGCMAVMVVPETPLAALFVLRCAIAPIAPCSPAPERPPAARPCARPSPRPGLLGAGVMTLQGLGMAAGGALAEAVPAYAVICGAGAVGTLSVLGLLRSVHHSRALSPRPS